MGFISLSVKLRPDYSLRVLVWVDSVVVTGFIQRRRCLILLWRRRGYELVFCGGLCQIVSFFIWFLLCFFRLCYWRMFLFCFVEMKMGGGFVPTLWFGLKILNLIFFFLVWRSRFFSYGVVLLDVYLHSRWLVLSWCFSKGLGA